MKAGHLNTEVNKWIEFTIIVYKVFMKISLQICQMVSTLKRQSLSINKKFLDIVFIDQNLHQRLLVS